MSPANLNQFLDESPVLFCLEIDRRMATPAGDRAAPVKPAEMLDAFMSAMCAGNDEANSSRGGRTADIGRRHGKIIP